MTPSRTTLLKAQILLAYASGGVVAFLTLLALPALPIPRVNPLGFIVYTILIPPLCQHWKRASSRDNMARGGHITSIIFWVTPILASLVALTAMLVKASQDRPGTFPGDIHPIAFISFPIVGLVWFSIPLACSILVARIDSAPATSHPTPA